MKLIFHPGNDEPMGRWFVPLRCTSNKKVMPPEFDGVNPETMGVTVFACGAEGAKLAAVEKATDKYLRHQNKHTRWAVTGEPEEC